MCRHPGGRKACGEATRPSTFAGFEAAPGGHISSLEAGARSCGPLSGALQPCLCYAGGALGVIAARLMGSDWYYIPMEAVVDQAGRIVLPKFIRDALGLLPGTKVDISPYGAGVQVVPAGRTARLVEEDGVLVSAGDTPVDDDILFGLIDAGRK
jgi:AbrB family looped-hinge helix DNA binding protein